MKAIDILKITTREVSSIKYPIVGDDIDNYTSEFLRRVNKYFRNVTEAETLLRVLCYVCNAINSLDADAEGLTVQLQPSISNHQTFTDILVVVSEINLPRCFIEVKNVTLSTDLTLQTDQSAQALREAHLLLCESRYSLQEIPFVLTNSSQWSFGNAKKRGEKIHLDKIMNILLDTDSSKKLNAALKQLIKGRFPQCK